MVLTASSGGTSGSGGGKLLARVRIAAGVGTATNVANHLVHGTRDPVTLLGHAVIGELTAATAWALATEGPILIRVHIGTAQLPTGYFLEDPAILAEDFRRWLRSRSTTTADPASFG